MSAPRAPWFAVRSDWRSVSDNPLDSLFSFSQEESGTGALIVGRAGSGKSVAIQHLIARQVLTGGSFVSLDFRREGNFTAAHICARGGVDPRKTRVIDLGEEPATGYDPYSEGDPDEAALSTASAIESVSGGEFGPLTREYTLNSSRICARAGLKLTDLERVFHDPGFLARLVSECPDERLSAFWGRYLELSRERRAAAASPVLNKLAPVLSTRNLRGLFASDNPIDLRKHLDTPGSALLVSLDADRLHGAARMVGSMLLSSVWRAVTARSGTPESRRNPVVVIVDEFEHFQHMPEFESILVEGRKYKLSPIMAHQSLVQLSPRVREIVFGNVGVKVCLNCSRSDGAVLSRDLTGDPRALDMAGLPVGHGWVWTRRQGCVPVEINAPLVEDAGAPTPAGRRFLEEVRFHTLRQGYRPVPRRDDSEKEVRDAREDRTAGPSRAGSENRSEPAERGRTRGQRSDMENWLEDH